MSTLARANDRGTLDGPGDEAQFGWLVSVAVDADGNVYVAESQSARLRMIAPDGSVSTIDDEAAGHIHALAVEPDGSLLISRGGRIWRRSPDGAISLIAGDGSPRISALTVGDDGSIFYAVIESSLTAIRRVDSGGVSTVFQDRPGLLGGALSHYTQGIAAAPGGAIYVADYVFDRVIRIAPDGTAAIVADSETVGVTRFEPVSIAVTSEGDLLVSDGRYNVIWKITIDEDAGP